MSDSDLNSVNSDIVEEQQEDQPHENHDHCQFCQEGGTVIEVTLRCGHRAHTDCFFSRPYTNRCRICNEVIYLYTDDTATQSDDEYVERALKRLKERFQDKSEIKKIKTGIKGIVNAKREWGKANAAYMKCLTSEKKEFREKIKIYVDAISVEQKLAEQRIRSLPERVAAVQKRRLYMARLSSFRRAYNISMLDYWRMRRTKEKLFGYSLSSLMKHFHGFSRRRWRYIRSENLKWVFRVRI